MRWKTNATDGVVAVDVSADEQRQPVEQRRPIRVRRRPALAVGAARQRVLDVAVVAPPEDAVQHVHRAALLRRALEAQPEHPNPCFHQ